MYVSAFSRSYVRGVLLESKAFWMEDFPFIRELCIIFAYKFVTYRSELSWNLNLMHIAVLFRHTTEVAYTWRHLKIFHHMHKLHLHYKTDKNVEVFTNLIDVAHSMIQFEFLWRIPKNISFNIRRFQINFSFISMNKILQVLNLIS